MTSSNPEDQKSYVSNTENSTDPLAKEKGPKKWVVAIGVIVAYALMTMTPLIGIDQGEGDTFATMRIITASMQGTLAELGILPILTAGLLMYIFLKLNLYKLDIENPEERNRYNLVRILLSVLITIIMALMILISGFYGINLDLFSQLGVIIQLTVAGILISLLDETINRGWGLGSGISIFLAVGNAIRVTNVLIAPNNILEGPNDVTSARGIILAVFYWVGEEDPLSAFGNLFFRYSTNPSHNLNLPALSLFSVYLAGVFFILTVLIQTIWPKVNNQRSGKASRKLLFTPIMSIVLTGTILVLVRFTSLLVWNSSGRESSSFIFSFILGTYRLDHITAQYVPTGGLSYFFSPPPAFLDVLLQDPLSAIFHGIVYGAIFLGLYRYFTKLMFHIGGLIINSPQENIIDKKWMAMAIFCVITDLLNLLTVGLGIILLALILESYYRLLTKEIMPEFVRFDLERQARQESSIQIYSKRLTRSKYILNILLIGLGLFFLRFLVAVILGREV